MGKLKKTSIIAMFLTLFYCTSLYSNNAKMIFNFDTLYPETPFKDVLDSCMQIYGGVNSLTGTKFLIQDYDLLNDAIVGRLFHIRFCMENIKNQRPHVHDEDIAYLLILFDNILDCYKSVFKRHMSKPKTGYVMTLIREIKSKLQLFLDT